MDLQSGGDWGLEYLKQLFLHGVFWLLLYFPRQEGERDLCHQLSPKEGGSKEAAWRTSSAVPRMWGMVTWSVTDAEWGEAMVTCPRWERENETNRIRGAFLSPFSEVPGWSRQVRSCLLHSVLSTYSLHLLIYLLCCTCISFWYRHCSWASIKYHDSAFPYHPSLMGCP